MDNVDPRVIEYLKQRGIDSPATALDLEGLRRAQEEEAQIRHMQDVGRAGEMAAAAISRRAPDYSHFQVPTAVKDFLARQGLLKEASAEQDKKAAAALAASRAGTEEDLKRAQIEELKGRPELQASKLKQAMEKEAADRALRERSISSQEQYRKMATGMQAARLGLEKERLKLEQARLGAGGAGKEGEENAVTLKARAIMEGRQPPEMKGLYRMALPVSAELERHGFDLAKANLAWEGQKRLISSLNGPQQVRLGQATRMVDESLIKVEDLYKKWERQGIASEFPTLNRADLAIAIKQGGERGAAAQALTTLINDLILEQATVLMGGNAPTEQAMKHAEENLQAQWGGKTFHEALGLVKFNTNARMKILTESKPNLGSLGEKGGESGAKGSKRFVYDPSTGEFKEEGGS